MAELELDILRKPEHSVFFSFEFKVITVHCSEMNSDTDFFVCVCVSDTDFYQTHLTF